MTTSEDYKYYSLTDLPNQGGIDKEDVAWFINAQISVLVRTKAGEIDKVKIFHNELFRNIHSAELSVSKESLSTEIKKVRKLCEEYIHDNFIFVFGSNEAGIHGAGAAKYALEKKGAILRKAYGQWGMSFAIPTKSPHLRTLRRSEIEKYVANFIAEAKANPDNRYMITRIGCGLAGFKDADIAPLFHDAPENCWFDKAWFWMLPNHKSWGSF